MVLRGGIFLMSEVPLYPHAVELVNHNQQYLYTLGGVQGYLAHKKTDPPLGPP